MQGCVERVRRRAAQEDRRLGSLEERVLPTALCVVLSGLGRGGGALEGLVKDVLVVALICVEPQQAAVLVLKHLEVAHEGV